MNWLDPQFFAGGKIQLQARAAEVGIETKVGRPLGLDTSVASFAISEVVIENMASAARLHAIERGKSLENRTLIVTGGAAPLHAARLADKLGIDRLIVPISAGVGSAAGFLKAPIAYEVVRSRYQQLDRLDIELINRQFEEMRTEARSIVTSASSTSEFEDRRVAFMRYVGQGHEISVAVPARPLSSNDCISLKAAFEEAYQQLYHRTIPDHPIEILSWALTLSAPTEPPARVRPAANGHEPLPVGTRQAFDPNSTKIRSFSIYKRTELQPGYQLAGPAIISEDETTVVVPANFTVGVNSARYLVLERKRD